MEIRVPKLKSFSPKNSPQNLNIALSLKSLQSEINMTASMGQFLFSIKNS